MNAHRDGILRHYVNHLQLSTSIIQYLEILFTFLLSVWMFCLYVCILCVLHAHSACGEHRRLSDHLEL